MIRLRNKIILSLSSIVIFYSFVEVVLRVSGINFDFPKRLQFVPDFQVDPQLAKGFYIKDPVLFWKLSPQNRERGINSKGMRNEEFNVFKPRGTFRIICLGDSVTYGAKDDINKLQDTYPKRLEKLLNNKIGVLKFEVINAGIPGYTSYQGLKYLETEIIKYQPDLVTVHFGHDDANKALYFSDKEQRIQPSWLINIQNFLNKSKVYQFMARLIFSVKYNLLNYPELTKPENKVRVSPQDYRYNLEQMMDLSREHDFKIMFITPTIYEEGNIYFFPEYELPEKAPVVNLFPVLQKERLQELFIDNCHLTPKGHEIVAETIYDFLIKKGIVEER